MIILFSLFLPLFLYVLLHRFLTPTRSGCLKFFVLFTAFISCVTVIVVTHFSGHWTQGTQIVWTGVESSDGNINIGGVREEAITGWPNGSFAPVFNAKFDGTKKISIQLSNSGAFVFDETKKAYLNGRSLKSGDSLASGNLKVKLKPAWVGSDSIELLDLADNTLTRVEIPPTNMSRDQVFSVASLIAQKQSGNEQEAKNISQATKWASGKRIMRLQNGEILFLDERAETKECELPCRLTFHWLLQRLPVVVNGNEKKLALIFLPPWRVASPLPPEDNGKRTLTITANARPDDKAFVLPIGYALQDPRAKIEFAKDNSGMPVFTGQGVTVGQTAPNYFPRDMQPQTEAEKLGTGANVTSRLVFALNGTTTALTLATVNDLPSTKGIALFLLIAFAVYSGGVLITADSLPDHNTRRLALGISAVLWNFLVLRLLLSLRFAIDPHFLDGLTVKGVTLSFIAITIVPGLIFLWLRLRLHSEKVFEDEEKKRAFVFFVIWCFALLLLLCSVWFGVPYLWANMQSRFLPSRLWFGMLVSIFVYLLGVAVVIYRTDLKDERLKILHAIFIKPLQLDLVLAEQGKKLWDKVATEEKGNWLRLIAYVLIAFVIFGLLPPFVLFVLSRLWLLPSLVREVIILFCFCLIPALLWLASKNYFTPQQKETAAWKRLFWISWLLVPPVFAVPFFIGDSGSVLATLSLFVPVIFFLLAREPRRQGWMALAALTLVMLFAAFFVYKNLFYYLPVKIGESETRLLVFQEGADTLARVIFADTNEKLRKLQNTYLHTWEDQAMIYEGQWTGLGYGNAQTRLSQVSQNTLQYDSLFSFFIASEHGFIGGVSLLLLYAVPLLLLLQSGRQARFDYGRACALVITSAFLLEAIFHAGMNAGAFPLTGRNSPLLSINSLTDLLRWFFLFAFISQALLFRYSPKAKEMNDAEFLPVAEESKTADDEQSPKPKTTSSPKMRYTVAVAVVLLIPGLMLTRVVWANLNIIFDSSYQNPFEWKGVLARVDGMIKDGLIEVDPQTGHLKSKFPTSVPNSTLIEQEILRFNALPLNEKLDGATNTDINQKLKEVKSIAEFNLLLDGMRKEDVAQIKDARPTLFRLLPPVKWDNGGKIEQRGGYRVTTNAAFNSQISFLAGTKPENIPGVTFRNGQKVIGPAWVSGKWVTTFDPLVSLSWLKHLSRAMDAEWNPHSLGPIEAKKRYGTLSLDENLHKATIEFTAQKGLESYRKMFEKKEDGKEISSETGFGKDELRVPPRVALTVLDLPTGEVLALGGYPRMTAGNEWRSYGKDAGWLPASEWVEQQAPFSLRLLYGGDRNFDRMIVGSATKPLWASATLAVHENLNQGFAVNGGKGVENSIFGINIKGDAWEVPESRWRTFSDYLAWSDNRYHIRFGFLGLAEGSDKDVYFEKDDNSSSSSESMNGGKNVLGKFPKFQSITFNYKQPNRISDIDKTKFAEHFRRMYGVVVGDKKYGDRYSFWTKNEADDLARGDDSGKADITRLFASISPERANLALNNIEEPRDFISILLGGGSNRWSNVDLAAAFGTCLTGRPLISHITKTDKPFIPFNEKDSPDSRETFTSTAAKLRDGLEKVVTNGTATERLKESGATSYISFLRSKGYKIYAKTGTLREAETRDISRIVLAVVKWEDEAQGEIKSGMIFSLVSERAETGTATKWLGEFLASNTNQKEINRLLGIK